MKEIKQKPDSKKPKLLESAAKAPKTAMKDLWLKSKDKSIVELKETPFASQRGESSNAPANSAGDQMLSGMDIHDEKDMEAAAKIIGDTFGCAVLLKGGHSINDANDLLYMGGRSRWFLGKRIHNPNTHGTGCTLSSAIASNLAKGFSLEESVKRAKAYISGALADMLDLGAGSGPMNHGFALTGEFAKEA